MKYTSGFETFWQAWKKITGQLQGKKKSMTYWKRDKLEGREEEFITILKKQVEYRKKCKTQGRFVPQWCWCQKWLNEERYDFVPDIARPKPKPISEEVIEVCTPDQRRSIREELAKVKGTEKRVSIEDRKQEELKKLLRKNMNEKVPSN
jgi:hypothetical protein